MWNDLFTNILKLIAILIQISGSVSREDTKKISVFFMKKVLFFLVIQGPLPLLVVQPLLFIVWFPSNTEDVVKKVLLATRALRDR